MGDKTNTDVGTTVRWAFLALSLLLSPAREALELTVSGGTSAQREALAATTPAARIRSLTDERALDFWLRRLVSEGPKALQPFGYYEAQLTIDVTDGAVSVDLLPGEPVRVTAIDVGFSDPALSPAKRFPFVPGDVLDHQKYERAKQDFQTWLLNRGHLNARLTHAEVRVHRRERRAEIKLRWDPGPPFRISEVRLSDSPLDQQFLKRYINLKSGEVFSQTKLQTLSENLRSSGYFAAVEVVLGEPDSAQAEVPVEVRLTPRKRSAYQAGLLYATDAGPGVEAGAERRWLNSQGYQGRLQLELASRRSLAAARLDIPSPSDLDRSLAITLNYVDEETDSADRDTVQLGVSRLSRLGPWRRVDGLTYLFEDFQVGQEDESVSLLLGSFELSRTAGDTASEVPRHGWRASAIAQVGAEAVASDTNLARLDVNAKLIMSLGDHYRLLLRGEAGALWASEFGQVPASLRFFAGGDQSVRGFDFEALGPVDANGDPRGGRYLGVASAEIDGPLRGKFRWAAFVDAGNAFGPGADDVAYAAGLGVRWLTPIGPLRLDLAYPLSDEEDDGLRLHFTAGPDL
ncbi:MAG: autotransporter assembly complex family protein [Pseudomonadota bacterium]